MSRLSARVRSLKRAIADFRFRVGSAKIVYDGLTQNLDAPANAMENHYFRSAVRDKMWEVLSNINNSRAQIGQDIFVLMELDFMRNGYFVEFGAANGIELSNTYFLEREYGWNGILAEPARCWHSQLSKSRRCRIDQRCVWHSSGQRLEFSEPKSAAFATISQFASSDGHSAQRANAKRYQVETVSLMDLLIEHDAPQIIDYLSIDTEGSEFEILSAFDFDRFDIRVITCEHNYTSQREKIYELLTAKGYVRKFREFSRMDDWYVKA